MGRGFKADFGANKNPENPRGYAVPDFGVDRDIKWTEGSLNSAQKQLKHKWNPKQNAAGFWENMPAAAANSSYTYS